MSSPTIKVVLPLADALGSRRTGGKAVSLSKLIAAGFPVPRGFVLSADAYRSHLWASGTREIASAQVEAEEREAIRAAILAQPIPDDVRQAVLEAYERLSWRTGIPDPKVAVRSSALEDSRDGAGFSGAYESYLNVSGPEALDAAVKRVWASLWTGKAAAYRARFGSPSEPAMAVIVQQMVEADVTGSAFTANPVTGDPRSVMVAVRSDEGQSSHFNVDLRDFTVHPEHAVEAGKQPQHPEHPEPVEGRDGCDYDVLVKAVAEQSVLIEDVIGGKAEIEWAADRDGLWILQAGMIADLPAHFPTDSKDEAPWTREDARTISHIARSLIASDPDQQVLNGYLYACHSQQPERAGARLRQPEHPELVEGCAGRASQTINADPALLDGAALSSALKSAAQDARTSYRWLRRARHTSAACAETLREVVEDQSLLRRLLDGVRDATLERDALLQELSERFAIAQKSGKLEDEKWWRGFRGDVEQFARDYGYAFKDAGEAADPGRWLSWIEDPDAVFRMIGAISRRGNKPTLVTLHGAAEQGSLAAEAEALGSLRGGKQANLKRLLDLTRDWIRARSDIEQTCALASTALRLLLMEQAGRLERAGIISLRDDVFRLSLDELLGIPDDPDDSTRHELAALIARRKHEEWLEQRLTPPETLPIADSDTQDSAEPQIGRLNGIAASPGVASGRARIVTSIEDAAEIENGDIVVAAAAGTAWTPFLAVAGGLICESGWEFSPAAIAARTYGIPAVMACKGASAAIKDGHRITVDGSAGVVRT